MNQAQRIYELNRLEEISKGYSGGMNIFAFASGKGGTGKTFLSVNVAVALAKLKKKVLLIDLDFNFSNIHILLNRNPEISIYSYFKSETLLRETVCNFSPNLDIIFGDSGRRDYPHINELKIKIMFEQIKRLAGDYDFVILDCSSGGSEENLEIIANSGNLVVTVTPEPTSVMDGYVLLKLLNQRSRGINKFAIVNKTTGDEEGSLAFENLNKAAGHFLKESIEFAGSVSFSQEVPKTIMAQRPAVESFPGSTVSRQIFSIASGFEKITQLANNNH